MSVADVFAWAFFVFGVWNFIAEMFAVTASEYGTPEWHLVVFGLCPMYWIMRYLCQR